MFYFISILFSGIFMMVSLIIALVKYSSNKSGSGKWLIGFFIALACLLLSIFLFTKEVVNKGKNFVENMMQTQFDQIKVLDSLNDMQQINEDSVLQSKQVSVLLELEPEEYKNKVVSQFYSYLGFRDYFRLPLRYPYSLHCMDSLGNAELFNEENVMQFDTNGNGETSCDLSNINTFTFNKNILIGTKTKKEREKQSLIYFGYDLNKKEIKEFKTEKELINYAKANGFNKEIEFFTCKKYYELF